MVRNGSPIIHVIKTSAYSIDDIRNLGRNSDEGNGQLCMYVCIV